MFSNTIEVYGADARSQIMCLTSGSIKNEIVRLCETINPNNTVGHGFITLPTEMEDNLILNAIRYKDANDIYLKHLCSWYELDFALYDKDTKQVMVWGDMEKVKESIVELKLLIENVLRQELQNMKDEDIRERNLQRKLERDDFKDYDKFKHT